MELPLSKGTALVVVAHPDDETIWMGGTILMHPHVQWTVFSLCRRDDPDRAPKFKRVAQHLHARGIISDLEDEGVLNIRESVPEITKRLHSYFPHGRFDYLFTHGYNGEYGHPRHKGVHRAVKTFLARRTLRAKNAFTFSYELAQNGKRALPKTPADFTIELPKTILHNKRKIIHELYGFKNTTFEYKSCSEMETLNRLS